MSTQNSPDGASVRKHDAVLAYLLKHAYLAVTEHTDRALAPLQLTSRDLGALRVIAGGEARSQQEVAAVLGVDRTSMVALLDALERVGIVARRPSEQDRRRNVVELTETGRKRFIQAEQTSIAVEQKLVEALGADRAGELQRLLQSLLAANTDQTETAGQS